MASLLETGGHAGDEGNFEALYRTYKSEVQRLASYLLRNAADAEDASQTVFLNVLRALRQGVRPTEPRAWLLSITRNVCFSSRRAVACRPSEVEFDVETVSQAAEDRGPSSDEIVGALVRMQANQRTALILRDFRGASRSEIAGLLKMSTAGVEALLTRARIAFREELEAGEQPFDCDETKALVEQQLDGIITVSERHTLRTHLRHCSPCSTLARAVRSSRGKLAGLLVWPVQLASRLAGAFSQASTAVHVAAAISTTAAVATVAIPVAITHAPASTHAARPAPAAAAAAAPAHDSTPSATPTVFSPARAHAAAAAHSKGGHAAHTARVHAHAIHRSAPASATTTTVSIQHASPPAAASTPAVTQPVAVPPHPSSPAVRLGGKATPKPARTTTRRVIGRNAVRGRHPLPVDREPTSTPPADSLPPAQNGAVDGAGPGLVLGTTTPTTQSAPPSGGTAGSATRPSSTGGSSSAAGNGHHHKR